MSTKPSAKGFLSSLASSGLLNEATVERYRSAPGERLALLMIEDGVLTPYQAKVAIAGRADGLFIGDRYKILDLLGKGGQGRVYLCEQLMLQRLVAVKMMYRSREQKPGALERFLHEARVAAKFDHPNLVRVFDVDAFSGSPFIVMEYVDGADLHELVATHGPMRWRSAAHYARQAAAGLQEAHRAGLVHRDVKPGNLMLDRAGVVKLLDLGLARRFDVEPNRGLTSAFNPEAILGTADFIAPEQALASSQADIRADIYSLGCSLYFLLTGQLPAGDGTTVQKLLRHQSCEPRPIAELRSDVPAELTAVIQQMIRKDPAARYATPAEVVAALEPFAPSVVEPPSADQMPAPRLTNYRLGQISVRPATASPPAGPRSSAPHSSTPRSSVPRSEVARPTSALAAASRSTDNAPSRPKSSVSLPPEPAVDAGLDLGAVDSAAAFPSAPFPAAPVPAPAATPAAPAPAVRRPAVRAAAAVVSVLVLAAIAFGAWRLYDFAAAASAPLPPLVGRDDPPPRTASADDASPESEIALTVQPAAVRSAAIVRAGGSSFAKPVMDHWSKAYERRTKRKIEYASAGSSKGVEGVIAGFLDFGCSDAPLTDAQIADAKGQVVHVPLFMGAVVPTYNLTDDRGEPLQLRFTGPLLANIYLGKVTHWNDPSVVSNNPGAPLPDQPITVVARKDGSGTTNIWTDYLSKASSHWRAQVGVGNVVEWPVGVQAEKNNGVADLVSRTPGAIGYVELNYALANGLGYGPVRNREGAYVSPSVDSITAAAAGALDAIPDDFRYSLTDAPGENAYPIVGTTWALFRSDLPAEKREAVIEFLLWSGGEGQTHLADLTCGALPVGLVDRIRRTLEAPK